MNKKLLLVIAGGAALYWFVLRKPCQCQAEGGGNIKASAAAGMNSGPFWKQ